MLYDILRSFAWALFKAWNRLEVVGVENVPSDKKIILVANHVSNLDPIIVAVSVPRPVRFMAKNELFEIPFLKWLVSALGAFPVNREKTDFKAVKTALKILSDEEVLGVFPQGGTRKEDKDIIFRPGIAAIALKSKSPVLPIAITGTKNFLQILLFGKIKVHIGSTIYWPTDYQGKLQDEDVIKLTTEMEKNVQKLLETP